MELNPEHIELFDQYLQNQMSDSEQLAFEKRLKEEPELKAQLDLFVKCVDLVKEDNRRILKETIKQKGSFRYFGNLWGKKWTLAYAAIFVFFAIGLFWIERYEGKRNTKQDAIAWDDSESKNAPKTDIEPLLKDARKKKKRATPQSESDYDEATHEIIEPTDSVYDDLAEESFAAIPPPPELSDMEVNADLDEETDQALSAVPQARQGVAAESTSTSKQGLLEQEELISVKGSVVLLDTQYLVTTYPDSLQYHLKVAFVKSPLNSKVYSYSVVQQVRELSIYGVQPKAQIAFKELNNTLYVFDGKRVFKIIRTGGGNYLPLQPITDPQIIQIFISHHGN